jgi:hypothetical protein
MTDEEQDERAQSQEMQTPRGLPSVKDFDVPRETGSEGGGHRKARCHAERREEEYDGRVAQLLQRVIFSRRFHDMKGQVAEHRAPGVRRDLPGRRNKTPPRRRGEQHHDVEQTGQQPCEIGQEVPVTPQTQVLATGEGNQWRERSLLITGRPKPVARSAFFREFEPFTAGRAVIVPVKPRMCTQDLKTAANEKGDEEKIEEVRGPQP